MNIKDLQDAPELVRDYEKAIASQIDLAPALKKASPQSELPRWGQPRKEVTVTILATNTRALPMLTTAMKALPVPDSMMPTTAIKALTAPSLSMLLVLTRL